MNKNHKCVFAGALILAALAVACGCAWWCASPAEYECMVGLAYGKTINGVVYYAFHAADVEFSAAQSLDGFLREWRTDRFVQAAANRLHNASDFAALRYDEAFGLMRQVQVNVHHAKCCVNVVARANTCRVAGAVAEAFAEEIIESAKNESRKCQQQGVQQLARNCEKMAIEVQGIEGRVRVLQADAESDCAKTLQVLQDDLAAKKSLLRKMNATVEQMRKEDDWVGFFEKVGSIQCSHR